MTSDEQPSTIIDYARPDLRVPREWRNLDLIVGGAIVGILLLWRFAPISRTDQNGKVDAARNAVQNLSAAIDLYASDTGRLPTADEGLDALVTAPPTAGAAWHGPYLKRGIPNDSWGRPYIYRPGTPTSEAGYQVLSAGPDGIEGTADDIQ